MNKLNWHVTPVGKKLGITTDELNKHVKLKRGATFLEASNVMTVRELSNLIVCARMLGESRPIWSHAHTASRNLYIVELKASDGVHLIVFVVEDNQVGLVALSVDPAFPDTSKDLQSEAGDAILASVREFNAEEDEVPWNPPSQPGPSGLVM